MRSHLTLFLALLMPAMAPLISYAENSPEHQQIKDSVAAHYGELQSDLLKGDGGYLTSLLSLLHIPAEEKDGTIQRLRALSVAYPTPAEFAERVPDLAHQEQAPVIPRAPAVSESDLEQLFGHMKYKTHLHLSMIHGDEIDAIFRSFDQPRKTIWVKVMDSTGESERKSFRLQTIQKVTLVKDEKP